MPWFGLATFIGGAVLTGIMPAIDQHIPRGEMDASVYISRLEVARGANAFPCGKAPKGVPQHNFDDCCNDLKGKTLTINANGKTKSVKTDNVPYTCIAVAPWFTNANAGGPIPFACGDACLQYQGLSNREYTYLYKIWQSKHK